MFTSKKKNVFLIGTLLIFTEIKLKVLIELEENNGVFF